MSKDCKISVHSHKWRKSIAVCMKKSVIYVVSLNVYCFAMGIMACCQQISWEHPGSNPGNPKFYIKFSDAYHNVNLFLSLLKVNYSLLLSTIYVHHLQSRIHYPKSVFWSVIKIFKH